MKKIIMAGLVALCLLAIANQRASAWVNSRFGMGINANWQSGNNTWLWGVWRNGQVPGPDAFGYHDYQGAYPGYGAGGYCPTCVIPPTSPYYQGPSSYAPWAYSNASYPGYYGYGMPYYPSSFGR